MLNSLHVADKQFGKKMRTHAKDFGLNPKSAGDRQKMIGIINEIVDSPDEIRVGLWRDQPGKVHMYIKDGDVVLANGGEFVTILKDGIFNSRVMQAERI